MRAKHRIHRAHVDFAALATALARGGATVHPATTQGAFLQALGIAARRDRLLAAATGDQSTEIESAVARLVAPDGMGSLFKVLAATAPDLPPPPGFGA